ncbi:MAG: PAS domain S-box protein [Anaerolineales bacterium]|nr:PAS domain S-box protein [Anaerolineales bacterium]
MKKVLIADDKEESRYLLRTLLQSQGYEVEEAVHGAEALIKARQNPPALVISDLLMPVMDGYTLLRRWKADAQLKAVPFVVYTATYTDEKDERLARDMGADDFILKPSEPEPFSARIREVMRRAEEDGLALVRTPNPRQADITKEYDEVLIRKLEEKALQLEEANRVLQQEVAERKRAEMALVRSEEQLRSVVQTAGDAIVTYDAQGVIRQWNNAAETMFGYPESEMIGKPVMQILPERFRREFEKQPRPPAVTGQLILGQHPFQAAGIRRDGSEFPAEISISTWKSREGVSATAIIRNVTERQKAEEELRISRAMLQTVLDSIPSAVFWKDRDLRYLGANRTFLKYIGVKSSQEVVGKSDYDLPWEKKQAESFRSYDQKIIASGAAENDIIESFRQADGTTAWARTNKVPLRDSVGAVIGVLGTYEDITDRRRAEEALRHSEALFANAAVIARLGPWEYDVEKDLFTFNDQFYALFKTTASEAGGYTMTSAEYAARFVHPDDMDLVRAETQKALETPDPAFSRTLEHRIRFADGSPGYISVRFFIVKDTEGKTVKTYGVNQDITERKRSEEEIRKRVRELEGMNRVSVILRSSATLEEMIPRLLDESLSAVECDAGAVWLFDSSAGTLGRAADCGWFSNLPKTNPKPGEGFPGAIFGANQVHLIEEFARDPDLGVLRRDSFPPGWGGICLPVRSGQDSIGLICLAVPQPRKFTSEEVNLLVTIAEMAGTAIQRVQLYEQTRHQLERLSALHAIDTAITASLNLSVTMDFFLDQVVNQLRVDAAAVLLCNPRMMQLEYFAGRGFRGKGIAATRLRFGEGHAGRAAIERRISHVAITSNDPLAKPERVAGEGFVTHTSVPLIAKGQVKGILELFHRTPFVPKDDWLDFLNTLSGQAAIAIDNATLFSDLQGVNTQLARAYDSTLEGWSRAMDLRDKETEGHSQRVTETTLQLAKKIGIPNEELVHIRRGALLHDLGKLGVPDSILNKPDSLTAEEKAVMQRHPGLAYEMLMPIEFLRPALDIPYCHHERWDGSGYPRGLKGEQIPLAARVFAVADVFDALTSDRPYRPAWPEEKALDYIRDRSGQEFDPQVVKVFLELPR